MKWSSSLPWRLAAFTAGCFLWASDVPAEALSTSFSAARPGAAWFAVDGVGLVKLDELKFTVVLREPKKIKELTLAPDGTLWMLASGGVYRLVGETAQKVGDIRNPGLLGRMTFAPDGALWGFSHKGVHTFDGKTWSMEDKSLLGTDVKYLTGIAVDTSGTAWAATGDGVHRRVGGTWQKIDASATLQGKTVFFGDLAAKPDGALYAAHTGGVLELNGDAIRSLDLGPRFSSTLEMLAPGPDGRLRAKKGRGELLIASPAGGAEVLSAAKKNFRASAIDALAVDSAGRTWLGTDNGVVIVEPDGKVVEWVAGSITELVGKIEDIAVVGLGPDLPVDVVTEVAKGSVTGKLLRVGGAVAGVEVEICQSPRLVFTGTPCNEAPFQRSVTSDAEGIFTFTEVPLGTYQFAIREGEKWVLASADCCRNMKEGQTYDVGSINLGR